MTNPSVVMLAPVKPTPKAADTLRRWHRAGYGIVVGVDAADADSPKDADLIPHEVGSPLPATLVRLHRWQGYPHAANFLLRFALDRFPAAFYVIAADDIQPPTDPSGSVLSPAFLCAKYLDAAARTGNGRSPELVAAQPIGDRYGNTMNICGSPWLSEPLARLLIERCAGPFHEGYFHYYADQELHDVLVRRGLLVKDDAVHQRHLHWARDGGGRPEYLAVAGAREAEDRSLFLVRQAVGFAGYDALPDRFAP